MTTGTERTLFAFLDLTLIEEVPQGLQHILINDFAQKVGARLSFYSMENYFTLATQSILRTTLQGHPKVDGFVFFRLQQFAQSGKMNASLTHEILAAGYSLHFVREGLALNSVAELSSLHAALESFAFVNDRTRKTQFMDWVMHDLADRSAISLVS